MTLIFLGLRMLYVVFEITRIARWPRQYFPVSIRFKNCQELSLSAKLFFSRYLNYLGKTHCFTSSLPAWTGPWYQLPVVRCSTRFADTKTDRYWGRNSPVRYIDMTYRLSIYRHFWKISISISILIWSYLKISISISISIRQFQKYRYRYRYRYGDFGKYRYRYRYR